jgi:fermentation-respiration switch protein FrsA (DUF1100 family)
MLGLQGIQWRTGISPPPDVIDVIADISPRPLLLISSGPNEEMSHRIAGYFYDIAGEPKTLWSVPETGHGGIPAARPEEYERRVVTFFDQALPGDNNPD